jgi:predicted metal-dependent enzyme (double-stranded beta helix superfamily)
MLIRFYNEIETILMKSNSLSEQLPLMRNLTRDFLLKDEFRLDCVEKVIGSIKHYHNLHEPWPEPSLFYHEKLKFSFRMITWPGFYENNPHQHKTWSVTGVIHNQLDVTTYTLLENLQRLKRERAITAFKGEAGYLMPGCIHRVSNPSHEISASIHLFNNKDVTNPEDNAIWYPAPRKFDFRPGLVERALTACLYIAANCDTHRALVLINQIYQLATPSIKLLAMPFIYERDPNLANEYYKQFEKIIFNQETLPTNIHCESDRQS